MIREFMIESVYYTAYEDNEAMLDENGARILDEKTEVYGRKFSTDAGWFISALDMWPADVRQQIYTEAKKNGMNPHQLRSSIAMSKRRAEITGKDREGIGGAVKTAIIPGMDAYMAIYEKNLEEYNKQADLDLMYKEEIVDAYNAMMRSDAKTAISRIKKAQATGSKAEMGKLKSEGLGAVISAMERVDRLKNTYNVRMSDDDYTNMIIKAVYRPKKRETPDNIRQIVQMRIDYNNACCAMLREMLNANYKGLEVSTSLAGMLSKIDPKDLEADADPEKQRMAISQIKEAVVKHEAEFRKEYIWDFRPYGGGVVLLPYDDSKMPESVSIDRMLQTGMMNDLTIVGSEEGATNVMASFFSAFIRAGTSVRKRKLNTFTKRITKKYAENIHSLNVNRDAMITSLADYDRQIQNLENRRANFEVSGQITVESDVTRDTKTYKVNNETIDKAQKNLNALLEKEPSALFRSSYEKKINAARQVLDGMVKIRDNYWHEIDIQIDRIKKAKAEANRYLGYSGGSRNLTADEQAQIDDLQKKINDIKAKYKKSPKRDSNGNVIGQEKTKTIPDDEKRKIEEYENHIREIKGITSGKNGPTYESRLKDLEQEHERLMDDISKRIDQAEEKAQAEMDTLLVRTNKVMPFATSWTIGKTFTPNHGGPYTDMIKLLRACIKEFWSDSEWSKGKERMTINLVACNPAGKMMPADLKLSKRVMIRYARGNLVENAMPTDGYAKYLDEMAGLDIEDPFFMAESTLQETEYHLSNICNEAGMYYADVVRLDEAAAYKELNEGNFGNTLSSGWAKLKEFVKKAIVFLGKLFHSMIEHVRAWISKIKDFFKQIYDRVKGKGDFVESVPLNNATVDSNASVESRKVNTWKDLEESSTKAAEKISRAIKDLEGIQMENLKELDNSIEQLARDDMQIASDNPDLERLTEAMFS